MYCEETQRAIETSNFGSGTYTLSTLCQAHLSQCRECQDFAKEYALPDILRAVTYAPVPDYLEERILGPVVQEPTTTKTASLWWFMSATATVLAIVAFVMLDTFKTTSPILTNIQVAVEEVQPIRVMLSANTAMDNAQLRIAVSDNISVSGYENMRELNWNTNLKQGDNLLVLPIQLMQAGEGKIEVALQHEGAIKSYVINVSPKPVAEETNGGITI